MCVKRILKYVLGFISVIALVIGGLLAYLIWFQPPFFFPKPTGEYAVGVKEYHWVDESRKELYANDPTHPNRELMVKLWYPTTCQFPSTPPTRWSPDLVEYLKKNQKPMWLAIASRPFYSWAQPDAPFVSGIAKFPVIIFSHGRGPCNQDSNAAQCEELASHGYVVVGINHTYSSILTTFPDGRIIDGLKAMRHRDTGANFTQIKERDDKEIEVWVADVQFVIDQLGKLNTDKASLFYQRLDQGNLGIFGHSFGGATAIQVCRLDPRIKAGVDLDGGLFGFDAATPFNKPLMFMFNAPMVKSIDKPISQKVRKEFKITNDAEEKAFKELTYLSALELARTIGHDVYILSFKGFGHLDFSYGAQLKLASLLLRFVSNAGDKSIIGSINGARASEIINDYLVNFFDKYLKGKPSELLDGKAKQYDDVETLLTEQM